MDETISAAWERYKTRVLMPMAPPIQISECRMAFYGGVTSVLGILMELGKTRVTQEVGAERLQGLIDEVKAFRDLVLAEGTGGGHG